ncbi:MAG: GNAT family N-acetyltransferase [Candidatus Kerfeldbacteria bacterium]|nr:GNAT family N-acetyltransferase [Candidatus Kerfeldbacteria bacterium]
MKLRRAGKADYPKIKQLVGKFPRQLMAEIPSYYRFFVAVNERGEVVGCCALDVYSKRIAEIRSLAVAQAYQGRGLGTALVRACLRQARRQGISEVFAIIGRPAFFQKLGLKTFQNEKAAVFKRFK